MEPSQQHGSAKEAHVAGSYRVYGVVWFWLLIITLLELLVVLVHFPRGLLVVSLIIMSLMKAALIVAYFMHLRYERLSLVYTVLVPMFFLAIVLFAFTGPDALNVFRSR
jgi:cytochrome c oxidase subunit IV